MTRTRPITIDDEVVSLARRYRREAIASLVTVLRDEGATASAKAQASATLLAYSDGKPSQARQITVADISGMPDALREELLNALLGHYLPQGHQAMLAAACDEAVARAGLTFAKPNRFQRGPKAQAAPAALAPPLTPPSDAIRSDSSGHLGEAGACGGETPPAAVGPGFRGDGDLAEPRSKRTLKPPDNVVVMPGVARPYGLQYGLDTDLPHAPSKGNGHIPPDVVARSAHRNPTDPYDPWRRS